MTLSNKTSLQISQQLPEFIRDDVNYENFVLFLEAYYEWLETQYAANANSTIVSTTSQGITYGSKNILNYIDVDNTLDGFVQYFINDFLPYIPPDILSDKRKLLKLSKQFYQSKGTEKSYKFLFRVLYDSNAEIFNTNDVILRASDGKWLVSKYLRVDSTEHTAEMHEHWLMTIGFKVFGETSKSYATIDYVKITDTTTEIYISGIQRAFEAGENITVVDSNNLPVYFYGSEVYVQNQGYEIPMAAMPLTEKISGGVNSILINPNFKGLFYNSGDPVVAYGGLNPEKANAIGLSAVVGDTNLGSLKTLVVVNPSHGYRLPPNTTISITGGGGSNAAAQVSLLDESKFANLTFVTSNTLGAVANVMLGNTTNAQTYTTFAVAANTNSTLANTLTFKTFTVAPIGSVQITNIGKDYSNTPSISAQSNYTTDYGTDDFRFLGILQPIQIVNGGINYGNSNTITIIGGTGFGAYANITVNAAGSIISANYIYQDANTITYPLGGLGYDANYLPTVNISSLSGSNASLIVPGVMAIGAAFSPTTDSIGSIENIVITSSGEDYVSTPNISLKIADVAVINVSTAVPMVAGDLIYQGSFSNTASYSAYIDSTLKLSTAAPPNTANDVYQIRTYEYVGAYNSSLPLKVDRDISGTTYTLIMYPNNSYVDEFGNPTSIKRYGDGTARATASFLGGVITGQGRYLNDDGWISSLGRVLESKDYNKYTYILSSTQALAKYKELVLNLVHPSGMRMIGRNILRTANSFNFSSADTLQIGYPLDYVAGTAAYASLSVVKSERVAIDAQITSGDYNLAIRNNGTLWSWGLNSFGQLGLGDRTNRSSPVQVGSLSVWAKTSTGSSGSYSVLALQSNGTLWSWGNNSYGGLGLGDQTSRSSPVQVGTESYWSQISAGFFCVALQSNGTLWSWGFNGQGQLGLGDRTNRSSPVQVGTESYWSQISSSTNNNTLALQSNGTLWSWGYNLYGQLGLDDLIDRSSPVQVGTESNWSQVSVGSTHSLAIKTDGTLWAWGRNTSGQLGLSNTTNRSSPVQVGTSSNWNQISVGSSSSLALQSNGTLWSWGLNGNGQLGLSDLTNRSSPVQVGTLSTWFKINAAAENSMAVKYDGSLWVWGSNSFGQLNFLTAEFNYTWNKVNASSYHTLAIQSNGTLWSWGNNSWGRLGNNTQSQGGSSNPAQIGTGSNWSQVRAADIHSLALQSNGTLWSWGNNSFGQLGLSDLTHRSSPTQVGALSNWNQIDTGVAFSSAIKTDGTLWSWGNNSYGGLGLGDQTSRSSPVQVGTESYWSQISNGSFHTVALQSNGTLWSWGLNGDGQLGLSDLTNRSSPVQVGTLSNWSSVGTGGFHTLALQSDGTLWSWGRNDYGQLGLSNTTNRSSPVQVGSLLWQKIGNHKAFSSLAIQSNGTLWSWGRNSNGTLGLGDLVDRSSPVQVGTANNWSEVTGGMGFVYGFSLGIQSDGTLFGWGSNFYGTPYVNATVPTKISLYNLTTQRVPNRIGNENYWVFYDATLISGGAISNNIIKLTNVIAGNIGNTIFANDIIEFTATNNIRAYSTITNVDWANNLIYMQDNVFLTFANVAFASKNASSNIININTMTGQYDGNFTNLTKSNSIFFVGDTISLNNDGGNYIITKVFANGNFSISDQYGLLPSESIANTRITVNKNANTQSVIIYGDVGLYDTPQLTTEDGKSLITESGNFILIG